MAKKILESFAVRLDKVRGRAKVKVDKGDNHGNAHRLSFCCNGRLRHLLLDGKPVILGATMAVLIFWIIALYATAYGLAHVLKGY